MKKPKKIYWYKLTFKSSNFGIIDFFYYSFPVLLDKSEQEDLLEAEWNKKFGYDSASIELVKKLPKQDLEAQIKRYSLKIQKCRQCLKSLKEMK